MRFGLVSGDVRVELFPSRRGNPESGELVERVTATEPRLFETFDVVAAEAVEAGECVEFDCIDDVVVLASV